MHKFPQLLLLCLLLASNCLADGWQTGYPVGTPRARNTPGTPIEKPNVTTFGDVQIAPGPNASPIPVTGPGGAALPVAGSTPSAAQWARATVAAPNVPSAYGTPGLADTNAKRFCRIKNTSNQVVSASASGGVSDDIPEIAASGGTEMFDLSSDGRTINGNIQVRAPSATPSTGSVYINCFY